MTLLAVVSRTALSPGTDARGAVHRIRTVLLHPASGTPTADEHVRVRLPAHRREAAFGDVLTGHGTGARQTLRTAAACPGALVVAVHDGPRCWMRLGPRGGVRALEAAPGAGFEADPGAVPGAAPRTESGADAAGRMEELWETLASLAHSCLVAGVPVLAPGDTVVRLVRTQAPGSPSVSRASRCRTASASSDRARPTEE